MESGTERDRRIMTLFEAARQRPEPEREAFLKQACDSDEVLFEEVREMLSWDARMGSFLARPAVTYLEFNRPFAPGDLVSDRFEIVRVVGEGGMGVVYEAFDRKRCQRICIKSAKLGFRRLLSPELESALKVRHPNICLVNEIHSARTNGEDIDFLTMEFLEGETLAARLASEGKLPPAEAAEIARQLCAGLTEAHRSGILHRDLKSGNVILTRNNDGEMRAVITDFGLAIGVTEKGETGGTPRYMAPELWHGGKASKASDLFALGVMFYEMVTGRLPFDRARKPTAETLSGPKVVVPDNAPTVTMGATVPLPNDTGTAPPAPTTLVKGLSARWDEAILPCLEEDPAKRPPDARDVLARLDRKPISKTPFIAAAGVFAMLGVGAAIPGVRTSVMQRINPPNVRLAVLPIAGATDAAALGGGALQDASERIRRLRNGKSTVIVFPPAEAVAQNIHTPEQALKVLHATHALETSLERDGDGWTAHGAIIDLATQTHLGRDLTGRYNKDTIGSLPVALAGAAAGALRLGGARDPEKVNAQASASYLTGLSYLTQDRFHFDQAIGSLEAAAKLDPRSPLPLAGLADALVQKYQVTKDKRYLDDAKRALGSAQSLNPDSIRALMSAGNLETTVGRYENALEFYRRVQELEPRNTAAYIRLGIVYEASQMTDRAVQAYRQAMDLDPAYYYPYSSLGTLYYNHGNYVEAARQFQMSIDRAPGVLLSQTNLGAVLDTLDRREEAEKVFLDSLKVKTTPLALNSLGAIRARQGQYVEAVGYFARAIVLDPNNILFLGNLGDAHRWAGQQADAAKTYRRAMAVAVEELKQNVSRADTRAYVGYFAMRLGERQRARDEVAQALEHAPNDMKVIWRTVLTYEALGERGHALEALGSASPGLVRDLARHPDLADFSRDPRFQQITGKSGNNGGR